MTLEFHPDAEFDLADASTFYELRTKGLGGDFLDEVWRAFERIAIAPEGWPRIEGPVRRCAVERFPYVVYYRVDTARIFVPAVMHGKKKPGAWKGRR